MRQPDSTAFCSSEMLLMENTLRDPKRAIVSTP